MDFELSEFHRTLVDNVGQLMKSFPSTYWRERDQTHTFPHEFFDRCAAAGYLGLVIPEEYGGLGLGLQETTLILQEITAQGAGTSGAGAVHTNMFSIMPVVLSGSAVLKERYLPKMAAGKLKVSIAITEPDAGQDTLSIKTFAEKKGDRFVINGHKIWISAAQVADRMLLLTRTTALSKMKKKTDGLTVFFAPIDRKKMEIREIEKLGRAAVDSNEMWIDGLEVDEADVVGEVDKGFSVMFEATNPERIVVGAECVGMAAAAINKAVQYAKDRVVFGRPIGQNQGVQFPLAESFAKMQLIELMVRKASWLYDNKLPCGTEANLVKLLAADFATEAMDRAMVTMGGYAYAKEFDIERWFRELRLFKLAPIPEQMLLSYLGQHVLGMPRSF